MILGPSWMTFAGSVALAFALGGVGGLFKGIAHEKDKQTRVALSQSEDSRELERIANRANGKVDSDYQKSLSVETGRAAALRLERDRLRAAIAALPAVPESAASACGLDGERDASLRRLLTEGAELLAEGGERVGALTAKLTALQARESEVNQLLVKP